MIKKIFRRGKYIIIIALVLLFSRYVLFRDKVNSIPVREVEMKNRIVEKTLSVSGEVKARKSADLTFNSSSGEIFKIYVAKGDSVSKGELLVTLNASTSTYNLQSYKDARDVAIKDKQIYVENYETNMNVVGGEDEYRLNVARLDELISRAEATYKA
jgi:multidrug efflux pump subunit AcrA (membrane-fusion protein)